jgi:hypothetical protein
VGSAEIDRDYVANDTANGGNLLIVGNDSVLVSGPGQMNHYELHVAQNQIDVYGTDPFIPGQPVPALRLLATIPNANLSFTKGLVWLEDAHYNGNKFNTQGVHTFRWDNLGFDGPKTYRDYGFDVLDNATVKSDGSMSTGYTVTPGTTRLFSVPGVTWLQTPTGGQAVFSWFAFDQNVPSVRVNGGVWHDTVWPFDPVVGTERTISVPLAVSELHTGTNTIEFKNATGTVLHNISIIAVAAAPVP